MKKLFPILITVLLIVGFYFVTSKPPQSSSSSNNVFDDNQADIIIFKQEGCGHCKNVEDFIDQNQIDSKVKISSKELINSKANQDLMLEKVKLCPEIDTSQGMGVPFAFINSEKKCLLGDTPIIEYLKQKSGI